MPSIDRASSVLVAIGLGCVPAPPADPATNLVPARDDNGLIIGSIDWQDVTSLGPMSAERASSRAVGYLAIPNAGSRCTAFLVADGVAMTNNHCISDASDASGASISFRRELGVAVSDWATYDCSTFIGTDAGLDFTLIGCTGSPGQTYGVVTLDEGPVSSGDAIYVVHQNCDYYTTPSCAPNKKYSPGSITYAGSTLRHDADTLGGSSGSPVFSGDHHRVVGLHNSGYGNDGSGRGTENGSVPMAAIVAQIRSRFPTALAPAAPMTDPLEPNDSDVSATVVAGGFARSDLGIHTNDRDVFRIDVGSPGSISIAVDFSHAAGDVDAKLYAGSTGSNPIVTADSADDEEQLDATVAAGTYFVVVYGYNGAVNAYGLSVSLSAAPPLSTPPPLSRDAFEPNETMAVAPVVETPFAFDGRIQVSDEDYFTFTSDGSQRRIRLDFSHASGDLDLYLYNSNGARIATSDGTTDRELIESTLPAGTYYARIMGYSLATGDYHLTLE